MKRQVQETGIRPWYGGDWVSLQEELFKVIDGHFEQYGNMIIKGCEVVNAGADINPGIVGLWGKDSLNNDIYKIAVFEGLQAAASWPVYLVLEKEEEKRLYDVGTQKNVAITYKATPQYALPTGEYLIINQSGANQTYRDAIQSSSYRFVTDAEKSTWNAKASTAVATTSANGLMSASDKTKLNGVAENANNYTHPISHPASMISEDASHRFVTDSQIAGFWSGDGSTKLTTYKKVGIGTSSPDAFFHLSQVSNSVFLRLERTDTVGGIYDIGVNDAGLQFWAGGYVGALADIVFSQSGNVGIGANNPNDKLHVEGNVSVNGSYAQVRINTTSGTNFRFTNRNIANRLSIDNANLGTELVNITSDGKVGIGTIAPTEKLEVNGKVKADGFVPRNTIHGNVSENTVFDALSAVIPNIGDEIIISGGVYANTTVWTFSRAERATESVIRLFGIGDGGLRVIDIINGTATSYDFSLSW